MAQMLGGLLVPSTNHDRLAQLYASYGSVIYSRCIRLLGDQASAEDATQETFIRVQRHLERAPDSSREALVWIYRIATNYCLNEIRDRQRRPTSTQYESSRGAENLAEVLANRDLVVRIVDRSQKKLRSAAWLHYVDGLSQVEIAEVLGVSRRTVVNRLDDFKENARKFVGRSET